MTEKKKLPLFWRCYIIIFTSLIVLIIAGLAVFFAYMGAYEASLPSHTLGVFVATASDSLHGTVEYLYTDIDAPFDDKDAVVSAVADRLADAGTLKYKELSRGDSPEYSVFFGDGTPFCTVTLEKDGDADFGFSTWAVGGTVYEIGTELLPVKDILPYNALTVLAPEGSSVTVSGGSCTASEVYGTFETGSDFNRLTEAECRVIAYTAEPVYLSSSASVTYPDGDNASFDCDGSGSIDAYSEYYSSMLHDYTITVPENGKIYISGVQIGEEYITERNIPYPVGGSLAGQINAAAKDMPTRVRYFVPDILLSPEVTLENGGVTVALDGSDGVFEYGSAESGGAVSVTVSVPEGAVLALNGVTVGGEAVCDSYYADDVKNVTDFADVPLMTQYVVAGLNSIPDIQVADKNGAALPVSEENGAYIALPIDDGTLYDSFSQTATDFADAFLHFTAGGYENTDTNFAPVAARLLPGSDASKLMYAAKFSFGQNIPYDILSKEITLRDFRGWGEDCFSVTVDMTITLKNFRTVTDTITGMKLTYVKYGGEYKIAYIVFGKSSAEW